jgi:hypothetical protein
MLVSLDDNSVCAQLPSYRRRSWRSFFCVEASSPLVLLLLLQVCLVRRGVFHFSFILLLCASPVSRLALDYVSAEARRH